MINKAEKSVSNMVWTAKAIAALCVITAHSDFGSVQSHWLGMLLQRIGSMGVPVFLLLSAYYYRPEKFDSFWTLMKSRMGTYCPWLVWAAITYLWSNLRMGRTVDLHGFLQFFLGYNSLFYFLSVLMLLQVIFWLLRDQDIKVLAAVSTIVSILSTELAAFGITDQVIAQIGLTNYLNVFNWTGIFAMGLYVQSVSQEAVVAYIKNNAVWAMLIWVLLFLAGRYIERDEYGYFSILGIFMELVSTILLLWIAWEVCKKNWIVKLGKYSFGIYLVHINVVPVIYKFLGGNALGEILSPACAYAMSYFLICFAGFILKKVKLHYLTRYLLGIRTECGC